MEKKIEFNEEFSNEYDEMARERISGYDTIYELTEYLLEDNLGASAKVLVAGAGTGKEIVSFSKKNPEWTFVGFDPSEPMLALAKQKVLANNLEEKITLIHGLINAVDEREFNAATSLLVMHFLPDDGTKQEYLNEISARLKPGATLILVDLEGDRESDEYKTFDSAWKAQQLAARDDDEELVMEEFEIRAREVQFVPQHRIESLLNEAGFTNVHKFFKAYLFGGYVATKI
ncbi:MAG: class I SAM-dependent methyltransferase [bacterium]|nr:class I SAM-dependent methyltransferase [bacterium]